MGGARDDAAALLVHRLLEGLQSPWGKSHGKGGKGHGNLPNWSASGQGTKGQGNNAASAWDTARRQQWPCPECDFPNRANRQHCHKCGEPRPGGGKGSRKGAGKANGHRGHSPIGAGGSRPLLGNSGTLRGPVVQGRAPGQTSEPRVQQLAAGPRPRYADVASPTYRAPVSAKPAPPSLASGKGAKGGKGKGRQDSDVDIEDGFTTVDYRAGKKPKVGEEAGVQEAAAEGEAQGEDCQEHCTYGVDCTEYFQVGDGYKDGWEDAEYEYQDGTGEGDMLNEDGESDERERHEQELADIREKVRMRRETFHFLRDNRGKNHPCTKTALEDLAAAEREQARIKGPRTWWQEGRKDARRKQVLLRQRERLSTRFDEEEVRFRELCNAHDETQQEMRDRIKSLDNELAEIEERDRAYAEAQCRQEGYKTGGEEVEVAQRELLHKTAGKLAQVIEKASDEVREELNAINADMGTLHSLLVKGVRHHGQREMHQPPESALGINITSSRNKCTAGNASGRSREGEQQAGDGSADATSDALAPMQWAAEGTERERKPKRGIEGEAKVDGAAAAGGTPATSAAHKPECSPQTKAAQKAREEAAAQLRAAELAAKHQRALDHLRGRVQVEKARLLEDKQKEAGVGTMDVASNSTPEQLDRYTKIIEQHNQDVEAEVERRYAQMSEVEKSELLENEAYW